MNQKRTLLLQKLAAGVFLALFLFIHIVKLTHHHQSNQSITKVAGTGKHFVNNSDCSVCDYYFVKDSHNHVAFIQIEAPLLISHCYTDYLSQCLTSIGLSSSDRGPPAIA